MRSRHPRYEIGADGALYADGGERWELFKMEDCRLVISGSRGYHEDKHLPLLERAIELSGFKPTEILHGDNMISVDRLAQLYAAKHGLPCVGVPADWDGAIRRGLPRGAAGPIRNGVLAGRGHMLVALWDGISTGTQDMIRQMRRAQKPGFVYRVDTTTYERFGAQLDLFSAPGPRR